MAARRRWTRSSAIGVTDYDYVTQTDCMDAFMGSPLHRHVRNGSIASIQRCPLQVRYASPSSIVAVISDQTRLRSAYALQAAQEQAARRIQKLGVAISIPGCTICRDSANC